MNNLEVINKRVILFTCMSILILTFVQANIFDVNYDKNLLIKGEEIYLNYSSDVPDRLVISTLTYPDGKTESINLPTFLKLNYIGIYELEIIVSKEGYETITIEEQFGVIEKIDQFKFCEVNGVCDGDENSQNCPQDCTEKEFNNLWIIIPLIIIILGVLIFFVVKSKGKDFSTTVFSAALP